MNHARQHILKAYESLDSTRKKAHTAYLASLPNYEIYMRYSGCPPLPPMYVSTLQAQIADAHSEFKRGINADWRASVLRYPIVLDYFYSLIELQLPSDQSPEIAQPPFGPRSYADAGASALPRPGGVGKEREVGKDVLELSEPSGIGASGYESTSLLWSKVGLEASGAARSQSPKEPAENQDGNVPRVKIAILDTGIDLNHADKA